MPLRFRLSLFSRGAAPEGPSAAAPPSRLDRVVARQRPVRFPSEMEQRIEALEEEFSQPLYESSAYGSPGATPRED